MHFALWKRYTRKYSCARYLRCKITLGCTCSILSVLSTILVSCDGAIHVVFTVYSEVFDFYRAVFVPSSKLSGNFACLNFDGGQVEEKYFFFFFSCKCISIIISIVRLFDRGGSWKTFGYHFREKVEDLEDEIKISTFFHAFNIIQINYC